MNQEDINADLKMRFSQIISLVDLMLENNNDISPNILTIRDIAQLGLNNIKLEQPAILNTDIEKGLDDSKSNKVLDGDIAVNKLINKYE